MTAGRVTTPTPQRIRLFDGLQVVLHGTAVPLHGTPGALLRLVATYGALHLDEVVDALWPDCAPETGRSRLRNVLSRVRGACGSVLVRVDEGIALADGVEVDLHVAEAAARRALAAPRTTRELESALALLAGEPLAEDVYRAWAAAPRERVRLLRLQLIDALAEAAVDAGDLRSAAARYEQAAQLEPYDDGRLASLAAVLLEQGRWSAAHAAVERGTAALAELGLPPSPRLVRLRATLHRDDQQSRLSS